MATNGVILINLENRNSAEFNRISVPGSYAKALGAATAGTYVTVYKWMYNGFAMTASLCTAEDKTDYISLVDKTNGGELIVYDDDTITLVGAGPIVAPLSVTENGEYFAEDPAVGFNPVVVDVQGGASIIASMSEPQPEEGENGQIWLVYAEASYPVSEFPSAFMNLDNWSKNDAAFTEFDNVYVLGENRLYQKGGNGYERIYILAPVDQNSEYNFALDYYSPSGVSSGYGGQLNIKASFATEQQMKSSSALSVYSAMQNLSIAQESSYSHYSITFNSGSNTAVYLVIDLNIYDNNSCTLCFKNFALYKTGETPVVEEFHPITGTWAKAGGIWNTLVGTDIEDIGSVGPPEPPTVYSFPAYHIYSGSITDPYTMIVQKGHFVGTEFSTDWTPNDFVEDGEPITVQASNYSARPYICEGVLAISYATGWFLTATEFAHEYSVGLSMWANFPANTVLEQLDRDVSWSGKYYCADVGFEYTPSESENEWYHFSDDETYGD